MRFGLSYIDLMASYDEPKKVFVCVSVLRESGFLLRYFWHCYHLVSFVPMLILRYIV